jgi:hypothetical protein
VKPALRELPASFGWQSLPVTQQDLIGSRFANNDAHIRAEHCHKQIRRI